MTDENTNPETPSPAWFIEEGMPGIGNRPNWLPDKYKSTADLARAHSELEKKLGTAPENYDFSKSKYLDPDYEPFHELQRIAKDKRVPQEVMDKFIESVDKYMDEFTPNADEELKKLGDNARDRLQTLDNWAKNNLSLESYEALTSSIKNADAIKALEELRGKVMNTNTPQVPGNDGSISNSASLDDIKLELSNNLQKYKTDDAYRKDIQRRLEVAAKNTPGYVDKVGA